MRLAPLLSALCVVLAACASTDSDNTAFSKSGALAREEAKRRVEELRYLNGTELLESLWKLKELGDDAVAELRAGAASEDWLTRMSVVWVFGSMGDRRNIPTVQTLLADPVPEVRYQAADTLVKLGEPAGFPVLVDGLASGDIRVRYKCFQALRTATGQDFGYAHDAAPDARRQSVARWLDWLDSIQASAL